MSVLAASAGSGRAEQQAACIPEAPPFAAAPANQLKGEALSGPIAAKTLVVVRKQSGPAARTIRLHFQFRADGSALIRCEVHLREGALWRPCPRFNPGSPNAADRDVGIWRIEADQLLLQRVRFSAEGRDEGRFTFHGANGVIGIRRESGPHFCLPGVAKFE
ncbi:MAG TPA: hypothetical protein VIF14_15590 [Alphaproteobacteria bacterium]|jgi:hypothetical protein